MLSAHLSPKHKDPWQSCIAQAETTSHANSMTVKIFVSNNSKYIHMQNDITVVNHLEREYPQVDGATLDKPELPH